MTIVHVAVVVLLATIGGFTLGRAGRSGEQFGLIEQTATSEAGPAERLVVIGIALASIVGLVVILSVLAWLGLMLKTVVQ